MSEYKVHSVGSKEGSTFCGRETGMLGRFVPIKKSQEQSFWDIFERTDEPITCVYCRSGLHNLHKEMVAEGSESDEVKRILTRFGNARLRQWEKRIHPVGERV